MKSKRLIQIISMRSEKRKIPRAFLFFHEKTIKERIVMKKASGRLALLTCAVIFLCALAGCENNFTVTLDTNSYTAGDSGTATLANKSLVTAYLPGCSQFSYEKKIGGQWTDQGPAVVCVWEGTVVPVAAGSSHESAFTARKAGIWRLRYLVAFGCTEGKPLSEADCAARITIYSRQFLVAAVAHNAGCVESGGIVSTANCCLSSGDFPNTCLTGACGCAPENSHEVSVCECSEDMCFDGRACVKRKENRDGVARD
jgi:hypothetical protein